MFLLEGNIGVGKSTFLKLLQEGCPEVPVLQEPVDTWSGQTLGQSLLGNFYKEPHRWAYTIETLAMISRVKNHLQDQDQYHPFCIMERSVYSGHYVFARNDYANGYLSDIEWGIYSGWVDFLVHGYCRPPSGFIYLRAEPDVCFNRIRKRNRRGEESMSLDYVKQIGFWHDNFLIQKQDVVPNLKTVPVLVLDANSEFIFDPVVTQNYIEQVRNFLNITYSQDEACSL